MSDERRYHVDGDLVPRGEATVSVEDRGFQYGDAGFETMRAYGGDLFRWGAHAERLEETCEILALDHGLSRADLYDRVHATLDANDLEDAYVRLSISRGVQPGKLDPQPEVDPTVVVVVKPLPRGGVDGDPVWGGPATLRTVSTRRIPDAAVPARAKTHNYLNGILARLELRGTDADEAIMLDSAGNVAEGATSNVFAVDGDGLLTPALSGPVLPGITRETVFDIAQEEGIPVREATFGPEMLRTAEEVFCTNSTWEIRPVDAVDGTRIGGGPVTKLLARNYRERIEERFY
ncbi:aminotransferase class IV [Halolamina salifodinae]|uniref:Branched-chain amino acid aminotransferase n=1 Tax=Halolamina salifodinae TaxID=1202767 RepID=A0A8T4GRT6_9EURY|nr:aminotransferase class IV [Halolamina salifodinae]MBP1985566.1 branched-chain amino acid aminotransferase [Halolamina salifodinae]